MMMIIMMINMTMIMMINMMINDETLEKEETALQMKFQDQILLQNFPADDRDDGHDDDYQDHEHDAIDNNYDVQRIFGIGQENHPYFHNGSINVS